MANSDEQTKLYYWFAIYVGIFGAMLTLQGFMVSLARLAAYKAKKVDNIQQDDGLDYKLCWSEIYVIISNVSYISSYFIILHETNTSDIKHML